MKIWFFGKGGGGDSNDPKMCKVVVVQIKIVQEHAAVIFDKVIICMILFCRTSK